MDEMDEVEARFEALWAKYSNSGSGSGSGGSDPSDNTTANQDLGENSPPNPSKADNDEQPNDDPFGMTAARVREACVASGGFVTDRLNETLFLGHKGFQRVAGLETFTGARSVFLNDNSLTDLSGLSPVSAQLLCLFAQGNALTDLATLPALPEVKAINLANNGLASLEGLDQKCPRLAQLDLSRNRLTSAGELGPLRGLAHLQTLTLTGNEVSGLEELLALLSSLPCLTTVHLQGNPVVQEDKYRKRVISAVAGLVYLDERPVRDDERRLAVAFVQGGKDGEALVREAIEAEREDRERRERESFEMFQEDARARALREHYDFIERGIVPQKKVYVSYRDDDASGDEDDGETGRIDYAALN